MNLDEPDRLIVREMLLKYEARHIGDCPQRNQNYWRMRGEYRKYTPDKPCTCGLDEILGEHDMRAQS